MFENQTTMPAWVGYRNRPEQKDALEQYIERLDVLFGSLKVMKGTLDFKRGSIMGIEAGNVVMKASGLARILFGSVGDPPGIHDAGLSSRNMFYRIRICIGTGNPPLRYYPEKHR